MTESSGNYDFGEVSEYFRKKIPRASLAVVDSFSKTKDPLRLWALGHFEGYKATEIDALSCEWSLSGTSPIPQDVSGLMQDNRRKALEKLSQASAQVQSALEHQPNTRVSYRIIEEAFKAAYDAGSLDFPEGFMKVEFMKDLLVVFRLSMIK